MPQLSSADLTVLSLLKERRDSSGSTVSSAYLSSSRRSSGISPCFSSRRSSQASQPEAAQHRRHHNASTTDSYDPISTDASRRSSEASQCGGVGALWGGVCGGSGGTLNLTPAQHYRLKAKYAAATGGPPPTPLPNMERMSLKTRMAMMGDCQEGGGHHALPPLVPPRRCSDGGSNGYGSHGTYAVYGRRGLFPHEAPANVERRASDPVRPHAPDRFNLPSIQRFSSLNNVHPLPPLHAEGPGLSLQGYTRSDGNLRRGPPSPRPASISENAALEALAMEEDGGLLCDEDMLPDDLVQYLRSQGHGGLCSPPTDISLGPQPPGHPADFDLSQGNPLIQSCLQPPGEEPGKEGMPIQWNEVSSGSADKSPQKQQQRYGRWPASEQSASSHPFGTNGNLMVQQQLARHLPVSRDFQEQCAPQQGGFHQTGTFSGAHGGLGGSGRGAVAPHGQAAVTGQRHPCRVSSYTGCPEDRRGGLPPTHSFPQHDFPKVAHTRSACPGPQVSLQQNRPAGHQHGDGLLFPGANDHSHSSELCLHAQTLPPSCRSSTKQQQYIGNGAPGQQQCSRTDSAMNGSLSHQVSGLKLEASDHLQANPCSVAQQHQVFLEQGFQDQGMCFEAQDIKEPPFPDEDGPCLLSMMATGPPAQGVSDVLSPGADQVTSTVDSGANLLDSVALDFDAILDDGYDHGSLTSGVLSPGIFQNLSRNSSRLTTPRTSVTFHSVPAGLNNMAIGDMSSLLTTLAEESKFLAIMQ